MYKWLLFDADNTILDFNAAADQALNAVFAAHGVELSAERRAAYERINHACWVAFERAEMSAETLRTERFARTIVELDLPGTAQAWSDTYLAWLGRGTQFLPDALDMLDAVKQRYNLFLITNGLREVQRPRFASADIDYYFSGTVISDEVGVAKPDPAIFDICFEQMGHPAKKDVLMIGDSLTSDIQGGINYGLDTCWVNLKGKDRPPNRPITFEVRSLNVLKTLLISHASRPC